MADPQLPQLQTQPVGAQEGGTDSSRTDSTTTDYENAQDADVVAPLASELAHLTGGNSETHGHTYSHTKASAYAVDTTRHEFLNPTKASQTASSGVGVASTYLSHDHATNGLLSSNSLRSPSSRKSLHGTSTPSGQSSSGSLHTLAEQEGNDATASIRRALSTRSTHSHSHTRRHSRSTSVTQPLKRPMNNDYPVYPDQSFAALQAQFHGGRPFPTLRSRSSHPSQNSLYNASHSSAPVSQDRLPIQQAARTADNTPMSSPGLYTPSGNRLTNKELRSISPQLHHLQAPKETHAAEIDHDLMTGNKIINNYEVIRELGRGEHGKVKLGRDIENDVKVAIKIVSRYSKHRRLGRLGEPQDQTKREVAILKKARHPNVVSLLEVIDDPNKNKVYLVLEFVENGEIIWRRRGVPSIVKINNIRFDAARRGVDLTTEPSEGDLFVVRTAALKHEGLERIRLHNAQNPGYAHYSFEHESDDGDAIERSLSRQLSETSFPTRTHSQDDYSSMNGFDLTGSMYGAYDDRQHRPERKYSIATAVSHMSSEPDLFEEDEQFTQVPTLTQDETRRAFRDTLSGLEFLHSIGIIHRDIKPSNLLIGVGGIVKISDFGVSYLGRPLTEEEAEVKTAEKDAGSIDDEKELARSVGTPAFWAPELCYEDTNIFEDGKTPKITGALDLWALGITMYCMVYARLPFYANNGIGLHEAACTTDPCCPKTRLVAADTTYEQHITHTTMPMNSNKRLDYELKFEHVPECLRDLIQKLLIKDPAKRITIPQAKRHPWVLEGMTDVDKWLKSPEIERDSKRILEPNEKEISRAVTKRSIFERTLNAAGRLADSLLGRDKSRKRASSTATSASTSSESISLQSPSGSNASTIGKADRTKEARRTSLRGDEVLQALHKSRENTEHPLAQSQSASPDLKEHPDYFSTGTISSKPSSPRVAPVPDIDIRPKGPERGISSMSASESIKTVRATVSERSIDETARESDTLVLPEINIRSRMEGFWEGTTRGLSRLTSRDRRYNSSSRSPSASRKSSESEVRALPSLAVSTTTAAGSFETPEALSSAESRSEPRSTPGNARSPEQSQHAYHPPLISTPSAFEQAQTINYRRHVQESLRKDNDATSELQAEVPQTPDDCPPSPDDLTFQNNLHQTTGYAPQGTPNGIIQSAPSASTIASSIDDFGASSVSQSVSDPSFGAISGASSPPTEGFLSAEYKHLTQSHQSHTHTADTEPDFMRTADTVTEHGRPKVATASGKALEQQPYSYTDDDDENDSSDEEGIMMGGPQKR